MNKVRKLCRNRWYRGVLTVNTLTIVTIPFSIGSELRWDKLQPILEVKTPLPNTRNGSRAREEATKAGSKLTFSRKVPKDLHLWDVLRQPPARVLFHEVREEMIYFIKWTFYMFYNALGTSLGESPAPLTSAFASAWPINSWVATSCWKSSSKRWVLLSAYLSGLLVWLQMSGSVHGRLQMSSPQCKAMCTDWWVCNAQCFLFLPHNLI